MPWSKKISNSLVKPAIGGIHKFAVIFLWLHCTNLSQMFERVDLRCLQMIEKRHKNSSFVHWTKIIYNKLNYRGHTHTASLGRIFWFLNISQIFVIDDHNESIINSIEFNFIARDTIIFQTESSEMWAATTNFWFFSLIFFLSICFDYEYTVTQTRGGFCWFFRPMSEWRVEKNYA